MSEPTLTPSRLWKRMNADQRLRAATAFWLAEPINEQVQATLLIAKEKKFRAKTVIALNADRKARHLASLGWLPDAIAARALVEYHLAGQRPMMVAFLDALGIRHEDGLIKEDGIVPDPEKVGPAAAALAAAFPPESVWLYLNTLLCQDPDTWGVLMELPEVGDRSFTSPPL